MKSPAIQRAVVYIRHPNFTLVICGVVACLAFLILVSFAALSWVSSEASSTTALGLWLGEGQGFAKVRFIDRFLITIPLAALTLITVALLVILRRLPTDQGLVSLVAVALFLLIFPYIWKGISTNELRQDLPANVKISDITNLYSTELHTIFSLLAVIISTLGTALYFADQHGLLSTIETETTPNNDTP